MENQEEQAVQYTSNDDKLKKARTREFKKRLAIAGAVTGLAALAMNSLPIVRSLGGIDSVKNVSKIVPLLSVSPSPYNGISFEAIASDQYSGFFIWNQPGEGISFRFLQGSIEWKDGCYRVNARSDKFRSYFRGKI